MSFKFLFNACLIILSVISTAALKAAEWRAEPSVYLSAQYNDNVRMLAEDNNPLASPAYTLDPRIIFSGEEQYLWDLSVDARGKVTRFQDIEDADSDNVFFEFDGGKQTERSDWRLKTSFERNSNFDTDFDTESPDAGLLNDHTERKAATVSPSVSWSMSESSEISFNLISTDVSYDEVIDPRLKNYDTDSFSFNAFWRITQSHQLGFTSSYIEYESPAANFSYDQTILQLDYSYTINQVSSISLSVGGRRLNSVTTVHVACVGNGVSVPIDDPFLEDLLVNGFCPETFDDIGGVIPITPVLEDQASEEDGTVVSFSYSSNTELASHNASVGRTVLPSSFGGAQEVRNASYQFNIKNTERLSTKFILDASETQTISGVDSSNDRTRYRVEPSISYKLNKNWNLSFSYKYIDQNLTNSNEDSVSNAVFVNLFLHWPKLATTY